jgi:hypothetical protein
MKIKFSIILVAAIAIICGISGTSFAFHSGGVAECEGCHSMHNSFEGTTNVTGRTFAQGTGPYLLKANDQGSTCLNCHNAADTAPSSYHISTNGITAYDSTVPVEMTPGGDFAWLKKTMTFIVRGNTTTNAGERHGHSIVAADYGYTADPDLSVAPAAPIRPATWPAPPAMILMAAIAATHRALTAPRVSRSSTAVPTPAAQTRPQAFPQSAHIVSSAAMAISRSPSPAPMLSGPTRWMSSLPPATTVLKQPPRPVSPMERT